MVDALPSPETVKNVRFFSVAFWWNDQGDMLPDGFVRGYPNIRSALLFQLVMMPSRFLLIMASSEEATMAANSPVISSACFRSLISCVDELSDFRLSSNTR
jgi:hypothetical protein